MLQPHVRPYSEMLDEAGYRVRLTGKLDQAANRRFEEQTSEAEATSLANAWRAMFRVKLRRIGVQLSSRSTVLDCCCGLGYLGETLTGDYGAQVTFCDLSHAQLGLLRRRNIGRAALVSEADLLHLPYADNTFDLVAGNSFLHHIADVPAALSELHRVVRPGGSLLLLHEPGLTASYWESFPWSLVKDTTATDASGFTDLWMFTPADLRRLMVDATFREVRVFGCGMAPALAINWYFLVAAKLKQTLLLKAAQAVRAATSSLDLAIPGEWKLRWSPSLMALARKAT